MSIKGVDRVSINYRRWLGEIGETVGAQPHP